MVDLGTLGGETDVGGGVFLAVEGEKSRGGRCRRPQPSLQEDRGVGSGEA